MAKSNSLHSFLFYNQKACTSECVSQWEKSPSPNKPHKSSHNNFHSIKVSELIPKDTSTFSEEECYVTSSLYLKENKGEE